MIFPRTKLIEQFVELYRNTESRYISIVWEKHSGKSHFLALIQDSEICTGKEIEIVHISINAPISSYVANNPKSKIIFIDSDFPLEIGEIRTFIEQYSDKSRIIYISEVETLDSDITTFRLPNISFREYSEWMQNPVDVWGIMSGKIDIEIYNKLRETYLHLGAYPVNLDNPEHIQVTFDNKLSIMNQELFKKEEWDFLEFIRTVAMTVGDIFKEERIAKSMNISRRKVRKYTEIMLKHDLIRAIGPWVENPNLELSRHVKVYFTDLSYLHAALWVSYYHWENKQWVIENFILNELDRKLKNTHDIQFYRKKSWAEVSFVLTDKKTKKLTPIEVTTRSSDIIPQALKIFYETYTGRIDHAMIMNDTIATQKTINGSPVIILPHIAI